MAHGIRRVLATAAAAAVVVGVGGQSPASASAQWAEDDFDVCVDQVASMCVTGVISWGNRVARVSGGVTNDVPGGIATVRWDAFSGATKVDSTTTYAPAPWSEIDFYLGDPNRVGGIDRIRIQVCSSPKRCSAQWNEIRN